jgi:hypothetical protein
VVDRLAKHSAWFETETKIRQHETITAHFASFQMYLESTEVQNEKEKALEKAQQDREYSEPIMPSVSVDSSPKAAQHVRELKNWIASPLYREIYERTKRDRLPGSGKRFLRDHRYLQWRDGGFQGNNPATSAYSLDAHLERILFVQGTSHISSQTSTHVQRHS